MTPERWERIETLFDAALELTPDDRARFLDAECGSDSSLRLELERMLRNDRPTGTVRHIVAQAAMLSCKPKIPGKAGAWALTEFSALSARAVWARSFSRCATTTSTARKLTIKTLKFEASDAFALNRFRLERQVLAGLKHPNIARLLDGGASEQGMPFIVMEYVAGVPISDSCREKGLSTEARLRLFRQVCNAVQYAPTAFCSISVWKWRRSRRHWALVSRPSRRMSE